MLKQIALLLCLVAYCYADDAEEHHSSHVHEHQFTDQEHYPEGEHNPAYDQAAFSGGEAGQYKDLGPEESKTKLRALVVKVDTDGNGRVTRSEMTAWITKSMKKYVYDDVNQQWGAINVDGDEVINWVEYKNHTYGYMDGSEEDDSYKQIIDRDQRRFNRADKNQDQELSRDEFLFFLHPEESDDMKDIVVEETMEDLDKNKDGFLSLEEYIGEVTPEDNGKEPEWVTSEREQFSEYRDANKDGRLDKEEVAKWIVPPDDNHAAEETKHLFEQADANEDDELSIDEIVDKHEIFVGSQATNYGSLLHEEL